MPAGSIGRPARQPHQVKGNFYALALIALAVTYAGHAWGLGRPRAWLAFVQRHRWLI